MADSDNTKIDAPLKESASPDLVPLESILCTEDLRRRPWRAPDYATENRALLKLASALAESPHNILQTLSETILEVTRSDSAGVSLLTADGKRFYWPAIAGVWKPHIGGGTPRNFGPCGDVLDRDTALLFRHLELRYTYFIPVSPPPVESLLLPFHVGGTAVGTIWSLMHEEGRKFDAEDERLMGVLGKVASLAYQTLASIDGLRVQISQRENAEAALRELANRLEEQVSQRTRLLSSLNERLSREGQRLAAQHTVTQVLAEAATLEQATPKIMQAVCECLGWDLGELWRVDRAAGVLRRVEVWHKESIEVPQFEAATREMTFLPGIGLPGRVWSSHEPAYIPDVVQESHFARAAVAAREGLHAAFAFPILLGSEALGVMAFFSREIRQPDQDLLDMMGTIGSQIGQFIERRHAEERIVQTTKELGRTIDLIPQLIVVLAPDGSVLHVNERMLEYTGVTLEDVQAGDFLKRVFHASELEGLQHERPQALACGVPFEMEQRIRRKDGEYRWFLTRLNPLRDEEGHILRWYGTGTDIHDRKQAEERVLSENVVLREEIDKTSMFEEIVGVSAPLRSVLAQVARVSPTDSTVLLTGETGTGKELVARAIHKLSKRSDRTLVSVNCAAIPPSLIASELFGHEKGAFTGALQSRQGRFELADGGTIFLDEVGELPAETQIALLRVLQEREFERVGGSRPIRTNVRVIAASNQDLEAAVAEDTFRADLFYRLNVFPMEMPALRDRREDIPVLVEYFIHRFAVRTGKKIRSITKPALDLLAAYDWPGNVRELQNVVERAVIVSDSGTLAIDERWLSGWPRVAYPAKAAPRQTLATAERDAIEKALMEAKGRVAGPFGAASRLGIPSSTLESRIKALKLDKKRFKPAPVLLH